MLADSLLPIPFWAEAVNTACYVQNRVLVTKPHNKTPYELLIGRTPIISFMRPFGCPVTILNTLDHLGKFDGKADEGFLVGYSINSKAFRVFNSRTRKVEENLHVNFLENKPNVAGSGPEWLFDIDILTNSMNYQPVSAGNRTNGNAGLETNSDAGQAGKENVPDQEYILLPLLHTSSNVPSNSEKDESSPKDDAGKMNEVRDSAKEGNMNGPGEAINTDSTNRLNTVSSPLNTVSSPLNTVSSPVNTVSSSFTTVDPGRAKEQRNEYESLFDPLIPDLEDTADLQDTGIFGSAYDDEYVGAEADLNNLETNMSVSPIPTTRIHKDHPKAQIIGEVEAMQEELLQFKLLNVWTLVDLPHGKKVIGTKWVFRNKRDQRGIVVRNKARLVAQGHRQEEGVDYDEVFAPVARIEAIRLFLAFASFMGFTVYQMDVKSAFLYGTIEEEVYVNQPPGFVDPEFPNRVYKVKKALYGLDQAPRAWYETLSTYLLENAFKRGTIDKTYFIKKIKNDILLVQVPDIMFAVCAYSRFQDSPMDLIAYSDSDYAGASIVLWLQNQLLDYGYNFMKTKIHVDNESAICVVKNPVYHSKTKHIEIRHHFIRDSYEKKLIEMVKIHRDYNVADLLTKAFDVTRFQFLIASIGEAHNVYYALKYDWKDLLHQTNSVKHIRISKEVGTLWYLSLVVPLTKVGDEAVHKELGDRMERAATTASSLEAE
ncbi:putative ribonuclease H-like domain-containing protein [Tanacetum coccineum]